MPHTGHCTVAAVVASTLSAILSGDAVSAQVERFFGITLSNQGRDSYLHGERVLVEVEVSNPTHSDLRYMSTLKSTGGFISGVYIQLFRNDREISPSPEFTDASPWGSQVWAGSMVRTLGMGRRIQSKVPLTTLYGTLEPGNYKAIALVAQESKQADVMGLAKGRAASKEIVFTVRDWRPRASVLKKMARSIGEARLETEVAIVETTDGHSLVSWKTGYSDQTRRALHVVPIGSEVALGDVLWHATEDACYIAQPAEGARTMKLIVVDRRGSSVSTLMLERPSQIPK